MKQIKTLLIIILCFNLNKAQSSPPHAIHNVLPMISDLETVKKISWCRLVLLPTLLTVVAYTHKDTIKSTIYNNPISFLAISYLLGNYLIDTVAKYNKVNKTLKFLLMSHTMNRYMLCAFAVKNNILQRHTTQAQSFDEQQFFKKINIYTGYTLEELEFFTTQLIHQCLCSIGDLRLDTHQDSNDDHMYYLLKDKITIEQILAASKHDIVLYHALIKYLQNPDEEYESITQTISLLIKEQINSFIKKNLHIFPGLR